MSGRLPRGGWSGRFPLNRAHPHSWLKGSKAFRQAVCRYLTRLQEEVDAMSSAIPCPRCPSRWASALLSHSSTRSPRDGRRFPAFPTTQKRSRPPPSTTCAHETSMRKRHRYVTVIVNGDTGKTLRMVEHRSSAVLTALLMSQPHSDGAEASRSSSPTAPRPTRPPWTPACRTRAMCWTASMSSDGSVRGSPRRAATSSAASPTASSPRSTPRCSGHGSC